MKNFHPSWPRDASAYDRACLSARASDVSVPLVSAVAAPLPAIAAPGASPRRIDGGVSVHAVSVAGRTRLVTLEERGGYRARITSASPCHVHVVNPAGCLAGGDTFALDVRAAPGSSLTLTTPAPERVHRSAGADTRVTHRVRVATGARVDLVPQPTMIYDGARYRRTLDLHVDDGGTLLAADGLLFGRAAHGEVLRDVALRDRWRVHVGGRLRFVDSLRLVGDAAALLADPALGGGARASALLVYVAPDATSRLYDARRLLGDANDAATSFVDGVLVVRWLSEDPAALALGVRRFLTEFRDTPLPRGA